MFFVRIFVMSFKCIEWCPCWSPLRSARLLETRRGSIPLSGPLAMLLLPESLMLFRVPAAGGVPRSPEECDKSTG